MVQVIELAQAPAVMVKAALHLKSLFHPREVHPLEMRVALAKHLAEAGAEVVVGPAHVMDEIAAFRELKHAEDSLGHLIYVFLRESFPVSHGRS